MNDTPDPYGDAALLEPTTIRPATPSDARAFDRLADLEDIEREDGPHFRRDLALPT